MRHFENPFFVSSFSAIELDIEVNCSQNKSDKDTSFLEEEKVKSDDNKCSFGTELKKFSSSWNHEIEKATTKKNVRTQERRAGKRDLSFFWARHDNATDYRVANEG